MTALLKGITAFRSGRRTDPLRAAPTGTPRVSVVVPCYNYGHYLPACLGSALNQPGVEVDTIVVQAIRLTGVERWPNGGRRRSPSDAHPPPAEQGPYRHLQRRTRGGPRRLRGAAAGGRSAGARLAGPCVRPLESNPAVGFAYGRALQFTGDPPTGDAGSVRSWTIWQGHDWLRMRWRTGRNAIWSPEVMMRASLQRRIGGYRADLPHSADMEMWMRAAAVSDVGHVDGPDQAYYRIHTANMHINSFDGACARGALVDLQQRRLTFEGLVALAPSPTDVEAAQRALAIEALTSATRSVSWDRPDVGVVRELVDFAVDVYPDAPELRQWVPVQRLLTIGPTRAKRHPAFVARAGGERAKEVARHWLMSHRGV